MSEKTKLASVILQLLLADKSKEVEFIVIVLEVGTAPSPEAVGVGMLKTVPTKVAAPDDPVVVKLYVVPAGVDQFPLPSIYCVDVPDNFFKNP